MSQLLSILILKLVLPLVADPLPLPFPLLFFILLFGGRILEKEEEGFWVVFILEDRRSHDVQGEARNTAEDLEVISIQREGIISNCFPHHASFSLCKNSKYKRQLDIVFRNYFFEFVFSSFSNLCFDCTFWLT